MFEAGQQRPGAMAAVLGLDLDAVERACAEAVAGKHEVVVAANLNAPDQTVISGDPAAVERASAGCKAAGAKRVLPLKVSGAFHSPLMEPAVEGLRDALRATPFGDPAFPVMANATAELVDDKGTAQALLAEQLTAPVRWVDLDARVAPAVARGTMARARARCRAGGTAEADRPGSELHCTGDRRRGGGLPRQ